MNKLFCVLVVSLSLLTACKDKNILTVPGYAEGKYTYISSPFGGLLMKLNVEPGQEVKIGQNLFTLEALPEHEDLAVATARVQEAINHKERAEANYLLLKKEIERKRYLSQKEIISKQELDSSGENYQRAFAEFKAANENLNALQASQRKARWAAQQKIVSSSISAIVFDTYYTPGEFVPNGNPVLALLAPSQVKIIFFIAEPWMSRLALNQIVEVTCDHCKQPLQGKINYISPQAEYTPPVIYSNEERAKLVYRFEALPVAKNASAKLHPGQPVSVTVKIP